MPRESGASSKHRPWFYLKSLWLLDRPLSRAMTTESYRQSLCRERAILQRQPEALPHVDERFGKRVDQRIILARL
jgi:hypothetical protein